MNVTNYNHNFKDIDCPKDLLFLHRKDGPGIFDLCKFCDKCNIFFIFVETHEDKIYHTNDIDCYFYLNNKEIFKNSITLEDLNLLCEEVSIKLLLE